MSAFQKEILKLISIFWKSNSTDDDAFLNALSLLTEKPVINKKSYSILKLKIYGIPVNYIYVTNIQKFIQDFSTEGINFICHNDQLHKNLLIELSNKNILSDFIPKNEKNIILEGCDIIEYSIYKIYTNFIEDNKTSNSLILNEQINIFSANLKQTKFELSRFDLSKVINETNNIDHPRNLIKNDNTDDLLDLINSDSFKAIFLIGNSASGKTSIALQISYLFSTASNNNKVFYINSHILNNFNITKLLVDIFQLALTLKKSKIVIIIDDLHSNLYATKKLFNLFELIKKNEYLSNNIRFIGVSWKGFVEELIETINIDYHKIEISPNYISSKLLNRIDISNDERNLIKEYIEGNLFLLNAFINLYKNENKSVKKSIQELPIYLYKKLQLDNDFDLKKGIYLTSILGKYEIDITEDFLLNKAELNLENIKTLIDNKILKKRGNDFTLGHRTYCNLLNEAMQEKEQEVSQWFIDKSFSNYADIILEFLYTQKSNRIFSIIQKLYKHANVDGSKRKQNIIFKTWKSIDLTIDRMIIQQRKDPTWDNTLSSAMFAVQTLSSVGYRKEARPSIDYIRTLYNSNLELDLTNEANSRDFNKIKSEVINQDNSENLIGEKGIELDEMKFYSNWAKGIILSAEGSQRELKPSSLLDLCNKVEKSAEKGNYFYPLRVPWCTSRVLIGLGLSGRNVENSVIIKDIVDWLLIHPNKTESGAWVSGTGNWNNWIETTSLAVLALLQVNIPKENKHIAKAIDILYSHKKEWIKDGKQIDGVTALQAYTNAGGNLMNVLDEISYFADWVLNSLWDNDNQTHLELLKQSCAVSQISSGLTEVMWKFLQEDLPSLIQAFDVDKNKLKKKIKPIIFVSYSWENEEEKQWVEKVFVPALINCFGKDNIIFDLKDMLKHKDNYHFMEKSIRNADIYLPVCTLSYKTKANDRKGAVGTEVKYMTDNIETNNTIVFPILKSGTKETALPTFLLGKFYIDFRRDSSFKSSFEELEEYILKSFNNKL